MLITIDSDFTTRSDDVFGPFSRARATTDYNIAFATLERAGNVAEPATLTLLGLGALGVAGLRRRIR